MRVNTIFFIFILFMSTCVAESDNKIKIGIIAPLTGEGATYGESMKNGFGLVFDNDDEFELIFEDSKLSPKDGISAANKLVFHDKVQIIYGAASSSVTLAIAPIAEKNKIIVFSSISTADAIEDSGDYIFRNVPSNKDQGIILSDFVLKKLEVMNTAILKENDDYGISLTNSFKEHYLSNSGKIIIEELYVSTDTDFRNQLNKIKNSSSEVIFIPGNYEESAIILRQAREMGISIPIIGGDGSYSMELINIAGKASENFYCSHFNLDQKSSFYSDFLKEFQSKFNRRPNVYEAYAFEAGFILKEALNKSQENSTQIKDYLLSTEFNSLTGPLQFNTKGEVERTFGILKISNGQFIIQ